jgi:hypothetical protein
MQFDPFFMNGSFLQNCLSGLIIVPEIRRSSLLFEQFYALGAGRQVKETSLRTPVVLSIPALVTLHQLAAFCLASKFISNFVIYNTFPSLNPPISDNLK